MRACQKSLVALGINILLGLSIIAGCAAVRKVTYPPDFIYLDREQVTSSMAHFSGNLWRIYDILANSETVLPYQREEIIDLLRDIEKATDQLGAGTPVTSHLLIDENIDQFKSDVRKAREAVEREIPNYFLVGRLSGSCTACHVIR
jgi:hypothetical protein